MRELEHYRTLVFDCDGVVLNSNHVKTKAFYNATLPFGEKAARLFIDYHAKNGGISRYRKFQHFLDVIAPQYATHPNAQCLDDLLQTYANEVVEGLLKCEIAPGLEALRVKTASTGWMIVSGGDQNELRDVFEKRGIAKYFDKGIFGSPATKEEILTHEEKTGNLTRPALFLGDSRYDMEAASFSNLDFVFVSAWSEIKEPTLFIEKNNLNQISGLHKLITSFTVN